MRFFLGLVVTVASASLEPLVRVEPYEEYEDPQVQDPCWMEDAVLIAPSKKLGDRYILPITSMRACMMITKIKNVHVIWTLHNLHYGVAETYSFTDLVTDSVRSVQTNTCGFKVHPVNVDLEFEINTKLAEYEDIFAKLPEKGINTILSMDRPAYEFHASMAKLFNRLHDAHTFYATPFDMFRVYFPVNFGSRMNPDGQQVITLRYSESKSDPLGQLALAYQKVYGVMPLPPEYNQAIVTHINGMEALDFLKYLVSDEGPLAGQFQQSEQRLNAYIFSAPLLVIAQVLSPLPDFDEVHLRFEDGFEVTLNLLGQFTDWSSSVYKSVDSMRSTKALEEYMHSNALFESFMENERDLEAKKPTLWKFASNVLQRLQQRKAYAIKPRGIPKKWIQMTRKHKALLDPVANVLRDNLLNIMEAAEEEDEEISTTTEPSMDDEEAYLKSLFARNRPEGDEDRLDRDIKHHLSGGRRGLSRNSGGDWRSVGGMEYSFLNDVVIVRIPTMNLEPRFTNDDLFQVFPDFVQVQAAARERGITRILFDVSGNQGGYVSAAYALLWYLMADQDKICAPLRKRITENWSEWIDSFGKGISSLVDKFLVPEGEALADRLEYIFDDLQSIVTMLYEGLGYTYERFGGVEQHEAINRIYNRKKEIREMESRTEKAAAIIAFIRNREFVPESELREHVIPASWSCPFNPEELLRADSSDPLWHYREADMKQWGLRPARYSKPGKFSECEIVIEMMPQVASGYEAGYWTQIAFVSDGTCGSACALFTQGIQLHGDAVAFTYGGLADTAMDVAAFAGGNVEQYDEFWPGLALGARLGNLASGGAASWTQTHAKSWVSSPIAFPTKAKANFNWNMMFAEALGEEALPRQFYLIPGRRHFNIWVSEETDRQTLYSEISTIGDWASVPAQFAATHGQCPGEVVPFTNRQSPRVY